MAEQMVVDWEHKWVTHHFEGFPWIDEDCPIEAYEEARRLWWPALKFSLRERTN